MSAEETVEIPIRLKQDVDTEGAKAAAGLKSVAAGLAGAAAAGDRFAAMKMPGVVKDGARLKMLGKEAADVAAQFAKMGAAKEAAAAAGVAASARLAKAEEAERKQKLAIAAAVQSLAAKESAAADKARGAREASAMALGMSSLNNSTKDANTDRANASKREADAMAAGLDRLKAASKEADAIRAHDDAAALASANKKAAIDEAAYQKAVAREARNDKAKAKLSESAYEKAVATANKTPASLQPKAAKPEFSSYQKLLGDVESVFGKKAAGATAGAAQGLAKVADNYDKMGPIGQSLIKGGAAIAVGAAALSIAAAGLLIAGAIKIGKVALEQSELKKATVAAFDRLSGGAGAANYKLALKLSADLNLDEAGTIASVKGLLQAKVDKNVIPLVVTAAADLKIAKGDEAANALTKGIEKISNKGKFGTEAIDSLAEAGVNAADVYAALAKNGESLATTMARVKTNQVSAAEGIKAVLAAVNKTSGGLAAASGKSIGGLAASIEKSFLHLFDDVDTGPLKETLTTVKALFDGEKGDKLKSSVTELGNAIFGIFKGLNTPEGKKALAEGFDKATEAASNAAVCMRAVDRGVTALGSNGGLAVLAMAADALLGPLKQAADILKLINALTGGKDVGGPSAAPAVASTFDTTAANDNATVAGGDIAGGLAAGVTAGGPEIAAAVTQAANDAVTAAKVALGIASPSKVFAGVGKWGALGMAKGMNDNAGLVADAGASMAGESVGGAAGGLGASSASSSSGSGPVQINITINPAAGTSAAQVGAMAAEATDAAHAAWLQSERRAKRDRGERSAA